MTRKADASTKTTDQEAEASQQAASDALENTITQDADAAAAIKAAAMAASKTPVHNADSADAEKQAAHDAEIARQKAVEDAVREANAGQLQQLGGSELNPGNPGHDADSGELVEK